MPSSGLCRAGVILLLLARLGLRAGKRRCERVLPLSQEVGKDARRPPPCQ